VTPTSFPVVLRADAGEESSAFEPSPPPPSSYMPSKWTRAPLSTPSQETQPAGAGARLFAYAIAIAAAAFAVLWFMSAS
jgi:hypothetical protein